MVSSVRTFRKGDKVRLKRPWGNFAAGAEAYLQDDPAKSGSVPIDEEKSPHKELVDMTFINIEMLELVDM